MKINNTLVIARMPFIPCLSFGDDVGVREAVDNWEKCKVNHRQFVRL